VLGGVLLVLRTLVLSGQGRWYFCCSRQHGAPLQLHHAVPPL